MKRPKTVKKVHPDHQIRLLLGEEPCALLDHELGCEPLAMSVLARRGLEDNPTVPGPLEPCLLVALKPKTDKARLAFAKAGAQAVQISYFPDADEDLELTMLRAFHEAAIRTKRLLEMHDGIGLVLP